jgi:hypothetical protein
MNANIAHPMEPNLSCDNLAAPIAGKRIAIITITEIIIPPAVLNLLLTASDNDSVAVFSGIGVSTGCCVGRGGVLIYNLLLVY